ncbi:FIG00607098: hypothetical protein [hydrothermal vent metagenome]|uniref:Sialate O-acetylesterase domain-containing protein n=1 Tax=hydrothermal vent metagenome TaxID=652676 RepID=A0A3B0ZNC1_9ZZZZ
MILVTVVSVWGIASYKYKFFPYSILDNVKFSFIDQAVHIESTFSDTSTKIKVACENIIGEKTMVALVFGQSNSANHGETKYKSEQAVFNFFDGSCYKASDPLLGATGNDGSPWSRFGDKVIVNNIYEKVLLVPIGYGGSGIERWDIGGDLHHRITHIINQLKSENIMVTHLLWHQGESEALLRTSKSEYKKRFLSMLATIRKHGVKVPIYVAVASRCYDRAVNLEIKEAQSELVDPTKGIYPGPNTDEINLVGDRYDGCHFSEVGLDKHANKWLKAILGEAQVQN